MRRLQRKIMKALSCAVLLSKNLDWDLLLSAWPSRNEEPCCGLHNGVIDKIRNHLPLSVHIRLLPLQAQCEIPLAGAH